MVVFLCGCCCCSVWLCGCECVGWCSLLACASVLLFAPGLPAFPLPFPFPFEPDDRAALPLTSSAISAADFFFLPFSSSDDRLELMIVSSVP